MILLIDNYDSFTYNLVQMAGTICPDIQVIRNDELSVDEIEALHPDRIILSPGPGHPEDAGVTIEVVQRLSDRIPVLGVCLGHQAICAAFDTEIIHAPKLMHGKSSILKRSNDSFLLADLPENFKAARYHSLAADESTLSDELKITARSDDGQIMAVEHISRPLYGVQFHPESILTDGGRKILARFLLEERPAA